MSDFAMFFLPFVTKACAIGLYRRGYRLGIIDVLLTIVCYGLYAINIVKLLHWTLASVEGSKLIAAAICATIALYAVDILADVFRAIRTQDMFRTSLELRCVCCMIGIVLGSLYFSMRITGAMTAAILDDIFVALYMGLVSGIFYVSVRPDNKLMEG